MPVSGSVPSSRGPLSSDASPGSVPSGALWEEVRFQFDVQNFEHVTHCEVLGFIDLCDERGPEIAEHLLPRDPTTGNIVELFFQLGGEAVFDVALKKA